MPTCVDGRVVGWEWRGVRRTSLSKMPALHEPSDPPQSRTFLHRRGGWVVCHLQCASTDWSKCSAWGSIMNRQPMVYRCSLGAKSLYTAKTVDADETEAL